MDKLPTRVTALFAALFALFLAGCARLAEIADDGAVVPVEQRVVLRGRIVSTPGVFSYVLAGRSPQIFLDVESLPERCRNRDCEISGVPRCRVRRYRAPGDPGYDPREQGATTDPDGYAWLIYLADVTVDGIAMESRLSANTRRAQMDDEEANPWIEAE